MMFFINWIMRIIRFVASVMFNYKCNITFIYTNKLYFIFIYQAAPAPILENLNFMFFRRLGVQDSISPNYLFYIFIREPKAIIS